MKSKILLLAIISIALSCKKAETIIESTPVATTAVEPETECYLFATQRDTISMSMVREGTRVSGQLDYKWFEKDHNTGEYTGSFEGDTLRIGYTFESEGLTSVREELFILQGSELVKGAGNMIEKNGGQVFEDRGKVVFDRTMVLTKSDCKQFKFNQ